MQRIKYKSDKLNKVYLKELTVHADDRGYLYEILRNDDKQFRNFGQVYINYTEPGVIKGFHMHKKQEDNFTCLSGRVRLVILDANTQEYIELFLGPEHLRCINIPTELMHGWQCLGIERACILNVASEVYDSKNPDEFRVPPNEYSYFSWRIINR